MLKIKTMVRVWGLIGLFLLNFAANAEAEVLFEQALSETDNYGAVSNIDGDLSADNFEVTGSSSKIQSISWYGMYNSAGTEATDTFNVRIFTLSGTEVFSSLDMDTVTKTYSGVNGADGKMIYAYDAAVTDIELSNGSYLLSISNENSGYSNWFWADGSGGDGISYYWDSGSSTWVEKNDGIDMAFTLNAVQETDSGESGGDGDSSCFITGILKSLDRDTMPKRNDQ